MYLCAMGGCVRSGMFVQAQLHDFEAVFRHVKAAVDHNTNPPLYYLNQLCQYALANVR